MFIKLLLTALAALAVGGATIVLADSGEPDLGLRSTTTTAEDVSGPCDEAEHASDPRCAGDGAGIDDDRGRDHPEDDANEAIDDDDGVIEDISGPCDEAEHAADPECTGVVATAPAVDDDDDAADDNSGPGSTSSGPGGPGDDGGDSSGPGGGGD